MTAVARRIRRSVSKSTRQANVTAHRTAPQLVASRSRRLSLVLCAALSVTFVASSFTPPQAKAAFPGRNGRIAISVLREPFTSLPGEDLLLGGDRDIFTFAPGGGAIQQVTTGAEADIQPAWSPDGQRIVFLRADVLNGAVTAADIFVINSDGSGATNLTNTPAYYEYQPSWSPDGKKIVFSSDQAQPDVEWRLLQRSGEHDLYVMDADGSNLVQLTSDPGMETHPTWSPDGRWIAYGRFDRPMGLIRPDGSGSVVLAGVRGTVPQWSPDGSRIVFAGTELTTMWMINRDGSGLRKLAPKSRDANTFPTWSPDGRWLAFMSDRDGSWKLYKMRPNGSGVRRLIDIDLQAPISTPDWGPRP